MSIFRICVKFQFWSQTPHPRLGVKFGVEEPAFGLAKFHPIGATYVAPTGRKTSKIAAWVTEIPACALASRMLPIIINKRAQNIAVSLKLERATVRKVNKGVV